MSSKHGGLGTMWRTCGRGGGGKLGAVEGEREQRVAARHRSRRDALGAAWQQPGDHRGPCQRVVRRAATAEQAAGRRARARAERAEAPTEESEHL
eukprot:scaffold17230_cov62-Phaeocystis_antarctica.AAC.10